MQKRCIIKSSLYRLIIFVSVLVSSSLLNAQQILVSGKVTDTLQNPLPYANILAIPKADNQDVKFAITENDGSYKLGLTKKDTFTSNRRFNQTTCIAVYKFC